MPTRILTLLAMLLLAPGAPALPTMTIDVLGGGPPDDVTSDGTFSGPNVNGVVFWELDQSQAIVDNATNFGLLQSWSVSARENPFVTNNITIQNTTANTVTYIATVLLPIPAFNYSAVVSSSVGATITDGGGGPANNSMLLAENGASFYRGQVNGATVLNLNPQTPLTTNECAPFPNQSGCSATGSDGIASMAAGPGTANDIAIVLRFSLSPMDSVSITSRFEIVPEPMTGVLFGMGLVGLAVAGRRRR